MAVSRAKKPRPATGTNDDTERAPRHWVILRKLSFGTPTPVGSRVFAQLASVIDICRQHGHAPLAHSTNVPSPTGELDYPSPPCRNQGVNDYAASNT